ncbi:GntR family transcriptional regulator [Spiribacter roseus]|uniref:GntR family transcriptional regulator n=1 Tax=Spiribacter roseus TaxID=1855875 RepID=UPI00132F7FCC|nr:GntR family transcriptional regulator [Spiribacter roseus]
MTGSLVGQSGRSKPRQVRQWHNGPTRQADVVYAALKGELYLASWALPGARLTENGLSDHFGTSRAPVREALKRMVQERYLSAHFRNGYTVRAFSIETFRELSEVRIVLESQAIRWALAQPSLDYDAQLEPLRAEWYASRQESDVSRIARLNWEFHAGIVALSGNSQLLQLHRDVLERVEVVQRLDFTEEDRIETTYDEHRAVIDALFRRDIEDAVRNLELHIRRSTAVVSQRMTDPASGYQSAANPEQRASTSAVAMCGDGSEPPSGGPVQRRSEC